MLYLTRKIGESIVVNNNIHITVVEVKGKSVKLGCVFPQDASVLRHELHEKLKEANITAATEIHSGESIDALANFVRNDQKKGKII